MNVLLYLRFVILTRLRGGRVEARDHVINLKLLRLRSSHLPLFRTYFFENYR